MAEKLSIDNHKKVLVICQHFWPENFRLNDICDYLIENGCEVDVLCGIPNYPGGKFFDGYGAFKNKKQLHGSINIERVLEIPRGNNSNLRIFLNYLSYPFFSLFHIPKLLFRNYDKIYIYQLSPVYMAIPGIILGKLKKIETVMYVLDLWPENLYSVLNIKNKVLRRLVKSSSYWYYRNVDKLIVLSERMKSRILGFVTLPEEKILIAPQHCEKIYEDKAGDLELRKKFSKGLNILFAGNISPAQDFETIIAAAQQLKEEGISDINWIIVGDGMSRKWLEAEIQKCGLTDKFFLEGSKPMEDIPKYTAIADGLLACLVQSDLLDATIPAKVTSYFAAGRPIVLAMDGEAQRIVNKVGCGFAGPSSDTKALANNIKSLYLMTATQRNTMGARCQIYYLKYFERAANLTEQVKFIFDKTE